MTLQEMVWSIRLFNNYNVSGQFKRMVYERSDKAFDDGNKRRDKLQCIKDLEEYRQKMREDFINNLGGLPPCNTPLNPQIIDVIQCEGFKIEKIIYESRPGAYVTANMYIPDNIDSPRGAVLYVCGHAKEAKQSYKYQVVCRYLVKAGLVVLAQDPVGQAERLSYYEKSIDNTTVGRGTTEHEYAGCQSLVLGDAIARYFLHDDIRGIDYLCSRNEVDNKKIGVTGNSGGGLQTSLLMICEPRIAAAAPATFIMNRQEYMYKDAEQDAEQVWPAFTDYGYDHEDILLSMAPRPVRVLACKYDFFPIEGTRKTVSRCKRFWEMYDKGNYLDLTEDSFTHKYTRKLAAAAAEFFSQHLVGRKIIPDDKSIKPIEPEELACTKSGQVRGEFKDARFVYEENLDRLNEKEKSRYSLSEKNYRERAVEWLRKKVFKDREKHELNPRHYRSQIVEDFYVEMCFWWSQKGMFNHACVFRNYKYIGHEIPVTIAVWNGGTKSICSHKSIIRRICQQGRAVMVLDVTASGVLRSNPTGYREIDEENRIIHKLSDDLIWLNDSIAALRTYDVIRALDMIDKWTGLKKDNTKIYARGRFGVYGYFAAALDNRIKDIEIRDCMGSYGNFVRDRHYDYDFCEVMDIVFPGILEYLDLPDIKKWLKKGEV